MRTCGQCKVDYPDAVDFCPRDGEKLPEPVRTRALFDPLIGSTIDGRYIVEALLGQGGMGFVYAGRHAIIDKRVAIKVLKPDPAQGVEEASQRFLVEAKAASKIGHQNIVDITDFGILPSGQAYFVMEFLDGPTLGKIVRDKTQLQPVRAIPIAIQIARGLSAAHDKGITHRDLKPENIFVIERDGQADVVKIVDFGIAKDQTYKKKLTQAGMVLGTPEYMSPEQATGQPTDTRVDMYALGCILYEMLTGDVPFKGETATRTLTMHVYEKVVPPSERRPELGIPPQLEAVVMRALQKRPDERFADLREMIGALERVAEELRRGERSSSQKISVRTALTQATSPDTAAALAAVRPKRALPVAIGLAGLLVVGGLALVLARPRHAQVKAARVGLPQLRVATTKAARQPAPIAPTEAAPAPVEITLSSVPPGAEVFEGQERLGLAPVKVERPHSEETLSFTFRYPGYREEIRQVVPKGDLDVEVVLARRERVASSRPAHHAGEAHRASKTSPPPRRVSDLRNPFE